MELSRRLKIIASMADESVIADIGCDHALVCIEAVRQGKVKKAYARDLREKPLIHAAKNILEAGLSSQIPVECVSGLHELKADVRQILMCGMGGRLMIDILKADPPGPGVCSMILSSHKDTRALREYLIEHGWKIESERVIEDGHFYPVLRVVRNTDERPQVLEEEDLELGYCVLPDEDYERYLDFARKLLLQRLSGMPQEKKGPALHLLELTERRKQSLFESSEYPQKVRFDSGMV